MARPAQHAGPLARLSRRNRAHAPVSRSHAWSISRATRASPSTPRRKSSARKETRSMPSSVWKLSQAKRSPAVLNSYHVTGKVVMAMDTDPETLEWIQKGGSPLPSRRSLIPWLLSDADAGQFVSSQAGVARNRLVEGQLCADPFLCGYWFCPHRQEQRGFFPAGKTERDQCAEVIERIACRRAKNVSG